MHDLLIAGGQQDPNVVTLLQRALLRKLKVVPLLIAKDSIPSFYWANGKADIEIDDKKYRFRAAFSRRNVFHDWKPEDTHSGEAWFAAIQGYLISNPKIRILNRSCQSTITNKLAVLVEAKKMGLTIPETIVTNQLDRLDTKQYKKFIAKPVAGGGYCIPLEEAVTDQTFRKGISAMPAIVQHKIHGADIRIYRIGKQWFGFRLTSSYLDYRQNNDVKIEMLKTLPQKIIKPLALLLDAMKMDWAATDFKENKNELVFLEVNSQPMFSRFDECAKGKVCDAILNMIC